MKKYEGLILFNDETVFMPQHNRVRLPVRVDERTAHIIQEEIKLHELNQFSCFSSIKTEWVDGKFIINTTYNPRTKCRPNLYTRARPIRTPICIEKICTGKCVDEFVRNVIARHILPDMYKKNER